MFEMRYTVIDANGTVSFVGPCHALKMLVAGCAKMPTDLAGLLDYVRHLDERFVDFVCSGLAVFDEHHTDPSATAEAATVATKPVFRVVDGASRQASLQPQRAGVVVFNLLERRIVQIHNTYADVQREDRGRLRREGQPIGRFYHYTLPETWKIVP